MCINDFRLYNNSTVVLSPSLTLNNTIIPVWGTGLYDRRENCTNKKPACSAMSLFDCHGNRVVKLLYCSS